MNFSRPAAAYDMGDQARFRDAVDQAFRKTYQSGQSVEVVPGAYIYMRSPDGNRWQLSVSDAGALVVTAA